MVALKLNLLLRGYAQTNIEEEESYPFDSFRGRERWKTLAQRRDRKEGGREGTKKDGANANGR